MEDRTSGLFVYFSTFSSFLSMFIPSASWLHFTMFNTSTTYLYSLTYGFTDDTVVLSLCFILTCCSYQYALVLVCFAALLQLRSHFLQGCLRYFYLFLSKTLFVFDILNTLPMSFCLKMNKKNCFATNVLIWSHL